MSLPRINHTQISNAFIDKWLPVCSPGEVKVFLIIARHTIGWHKETADLSLSRIETLSGLSRRTVYDMTEKLAERGLIVKTQGSAMTKYSINYDTVENVDNSVDNSSSGENSAPDEGAGGANSAPEKGSSGANFTPETGVTGAKIAHIERKGKEKRERKPSFSADIQKVFREAGSDYYHDGREAKAASLLSDRYGEDPERFKLFVLTLKKMRATDKFYKGMPLSPSTLNTFWNAVSSHIEVQQKNAPAQQETRMANGQTTREYMAQVERERKERGGI